MVEKPMGRSIKPVEKTTSMKQPNDVIAERLLQDSINSPMMDEEFGNLAWDHSQDKHTSSY